MKRLFILLSAVLSAQQAIDAPPLAHVLDGEGLLTPIHGLAGNFVSGRPGPVLLAYSNDGDIEWRLEAGRLSATRGDVTAVYATPATNAIFRGAVAVLPEFAEFLIFDGEDVHQTSDKSTLQLAGRTVLWKDGKLRIFQEDGALEEVECPVEPERMTAAAAHWAHLVIKNRPHLLRLTSGRVELFILPERLRE